MSTGTAVWTGQWAADHLGVTLTGSPELPRLLGLAVRENDKRAHLLVSNVLGKYVPQRPHIVHQTGLALGRRVLALLGEAAARAVVLGYAEAAAGLGQCVADGLGRAPYLHSTRRPVPSVPPVARFEEEHSHAAHHLLLPADPELLAGGGPLVLVDDELSTGNTLLNTVRALHTRYPRDHYVVAALADLRGPLDRARLTACAAELGARVDVLALAAGEVRVPPDVLTRGAHLVRRYGTAAPPHPPAPRRGAVSRVDLGWPPELPDGARHGFTPGHRTRLEAALPGMVNRLGSALPPGARRVLVLGCEELMYAPLRLAAALDAEADGIEVYFSSTTRSPALALDDPGYPLHTRIAFPTHDNPLDGAGERYAYNVAPSAHGMRRFDAIAVVVDSAGDTPRLTAPDGLLARLAAHTDRLLVAAIPSYVPEPQNHPHRHSTFPRQYNPNGRTGTMPCEPLRGPAFSSYAPDEVGWLLKDLSEVALEQPIEEREEAVQNGAHYAESLPVEYQPSAEYRRLFRTALARSARRLARAVGIVTETVLSERSPAPVLVSLARAGTPVGVLMRRWAQQAHGLELAHYTVSIVRGRGIDTTALRWIAQRHDPSDVVFVDGWTGKGAICRELRAALAPFRQMGFDPRLAVLADPGSCVDTFGTREDFLIPSACLNSTVTGLVSRTVLRPDLIGPGEFHGAKFYRELAEADVSGVFVDTVTKCFGDVVDTVATEVKEARAQDRIPTWAGWAAVEQISAEYGIGEANLVKPGVGEATRVLLRRVPWRILVHRGAGPELDHVRLLADQRGVLVEEVDDVLGPYRCVGLVHPRFTAGAIGADGRAVVRG
ncbi:phosphoribosyltransferase [Streptantibioticus rubrisoli]|uniref:Phosphoribosyltransferase n=1 Tax=Streptantibioticus rubrisoli TaxID=1387313 RepID=A0ABT1PGY6_9ACTN|nr:phosphoribosyltransferase [Streptantibioticus rubrisoli]MCQ4044632.1 phosphoribosyltransferase [Streptantibioticus rubrisoli]